MPEVESHGLSSEEVRALYVRYGYFLRRRCRVLLRDEALADDALQNTCMNLLRGGAELRTADEPLAYLYRAADRACFDLLRTRKRKPLHGAELDTLDTSSMGAAPGGDAWMMHAMHALLAELDDDERTLAVMAFVDGFDQGEIAERIGVSRVTVNKRVAALRERARLHLPDPRPRACAKPSGTGPDADPEGASS